MDVGSSSSLVGRVAERETLARALEGLGAGDGAIVVVEGEPGIGKSALLAELARRAREAGCAVRGARASEFEADLPYLIWHEALDVELERSDRHADARDAARRARGAGGHRSARALPRRRPLGRPGVARCTRGARAPAARGPVLLALASREGQVPGRARGGAWATERATHIMLRPLTRGRGDRAGRRDRERRSTPRPAAIRSTSSSSPERRAAAGSAHADGSVPPRSPRRWPPS